MCSCTSSSFSEWVLLSRVRSKPVSAGKKRVSQGKEECEELILQPLALPAPAVLEAHGALQNSKLA